MSIDVDGQEFWIWMALQPRPKVLLIEVNGGLARESSITIPFSTTYSWDGTIYHGASLLAYQKLAACKGYTLVWSNGVNCMVVRSDLVSNADMFEFDKIWRPFPPHKQDEQNRPWIKI